MGLLPKQTPEVFRLVNYLIPTRDASGNCAPGTLALGGESPWLERVCVLHPTAESLLLSLPAQLSGPIHVSDCNLCCCPPSPYSARCACVLYARSRAFMFWRICPLHRNSIVSGKIIRLVHWRSEGEGEKATESQNRPHRENHPLGSPPKKKSFYPGRIAGKYPRRLQASPVFMV